MKIKLIIPVIFLIVNACSKDKAGCLTGSGETVTVSMSIPAAIDNVVAYGRIRIHFIQDSLNRIDLTAGENLTDGIEITTTGNKLEIDNKNTCNWVRNLNQIPVATVHYTQLRYFGSENYYNNDFLIPHTGDTILFEYWTGSGTTTFTGNVDRAYFKINAGTGGYICKGQANYCYVYHSGGGRIDCRDFVAKDVLAATRSNNDVWVHCTSSIYCDIMRTGNIYYYGQPSQIIRVGQGSGQIVPL